MLGSYYFREINGRLIYLSTLTKGDSYELSLYVNDRMVDKTMLEYGKQTLKHEDIELQVEHKLMKSSRKLLVDGKEYQFEKIKKKELKKILENKNYHNEINPSTEHLEAIKLKPVSFVVPVIFLISGIVAYTLFGNSPRNLVKIIAYILLFIGPYLIFHVVSSRYRALQIKKLGLVVGLFGMIGISILIDQLNYGDRKSLYKALGTEQSIQTKAVITEVAYQGTVYYKGRAKNDPYYNHIYTFTIDDKPYEGRYTNPQQVLNAGDSIDIFYLIKDPRINRSVEKTENNKN